MKQAITLLAIPALAAALLAACQGTNPVAVGSIQPTYDDIAAKVFTTCSTRSCHSATSTKGGLQLTADVAYEQLVNVAAENDKAKLTNKKRVIPGDPANSFLVQKLESPPAGEGDMMPQRGQKLPDDQINAIKTWIQNGAKKTATPAVQFRL
ncbi:MAG: Fibronectin type domain protein [Cyanobacteria bacterium RYN_339]|nr:Fibronectin type domain protein [Cyanobacteria bacterium RYN_339]